MIKFCYVQKIVNITVTDGLKNIQSFIQKAKEKHREADIYDESVISKIVE